MKQSILALTCVQTWVASCPSLAGQSGDSKSMTEPPAFNDLGHPCALALKVSSAQNPGPGFWESNIYIGNNWYVCKSQKWYSISALLCL